MHRFPALLFFSFALVAGKNTIAQSKAHSPIDVISYHFEIELSDKSNSITGRALITVKFVAPASQVQFDLVSVEDDKGMYAFQARQGNDLLRSTHSDDVVTIMLNNPAKEGEQRTFEISYMGEPKDGLIISKNKYGDRTFFADNWPNRAHNWIPCIDRPDDKASFEFLVTAPSQYLVISNGTKIEETNLDGDRKRTYWKEETALPTKVMVIGVARFAVRQFQDSPLNLPITAWVYPQDSTRGFYDYGVTPRIVKFFSDYVAPFPYHKLANVQSKTIFGGMENASAIFYAEESVTGDRRWEDVFAHEIAHQWFGDMASEKSFAHLWLSEGFATYMTDIYFEHQYGKDSANKKLQKERDDVIAFVKKSDHPVVDSTSDLMSLLNANSYQKGSWVLHMLRGEVGDTVFRQIIREYYRQYKGSNADTRDFEKVAEKVSGKDLKWFFDQWLYRPGLPLLEIKTKMDGKEFKLQIKQEGAPYRFNLDVSLVGEDGQVMKKTFSVTGKESEFKVPVKGRMQCVIDPDVKLLYMVQ
jgi:aminopeptidase N